jgi:hypothetical protein
LWAQEKRWRLTVAVHPLFYRRPFVVILLIALLISLLPGPATAASAGAGPVTLLDTVPGPVRLGQAAPSGPHDRNDVLHLVIGLQPPFLAQEEQFLRELQTPTSPLFH